MPGDHQTCSHCKGTGSIERAPFENGPTTVVCPWCDGTGKPLTEDQIIAAGQRRLLERRRREGLAP
jgi:DnaJ-class molecular chaperone